MTLYEFLDVSPDEEVTVWDSTWDMETYFYKPDRPLSKLDDWDKAMLDIAKCLTVIKGGNGGITVDLYQTVERRYKEDGYIEGMNEGCDVDDFMNDADLIFAGNVSEQWLQRFAKWLSGNK